jgi:peptide/nickel transport system substrate-binding protein
MHRTYLLSRLLLVILASCRQGYGPVDEQRVFRYNEASNITSLDPAFARDQANIWAVNQLFNGLVQFSDNLEVIPCLASSWTISDDGLKYTFYLRKDACFHNDPCFAETDDRRVKASDFVFSFTRLMDAETASAGSWVFQHVSEEIPFSAPTDSILEIRLKNPFPPFLGLLAMQYCAVIPEKAVNYYGNDFHRRPVGTGPFYLAYWKEGVKMVLRKNPGYFESDGSTRLPYLEAVIITFMADKQAAFLEFVKGKLDFISGIDPAYKDELLSPEGSLNPAYSGKFNLITQPYLNTEYLGILMNSDTNPESQNPLLNRNIRKAINYGFDRRKMIRYLRNNIGIPGINGMIPPGMPSFDSGRVYYDYQPERSRELLREAGFTDQSMGIKITLVSTPDYLDICKFVQHQLAEIGLVLSIEISPAAAVKEMKALARLKFFRASWIADYPDAENYLSLFYSPNFCPAGPNYTHFRDTGFDRNFEHAMKEMNDSLRYGLYAEMENIVMEESPVIVLYYDQVLRFSQKNIHGLGINPMNLLNLKRVYKSD